MTQCPKRPLVVSRTVRLKTTASIIILFNSETSVQQCNPRPLDPQLKSICYAPGRINWTIFGYSSEIIV